MNVTPTRLPFHWRFAIAMITGLLMFALIWISSKFRQPPGVSLLGVLWLLIAYLTFEIVTRTQNRLTSSLPFRSDLLNTFFVVIGSALVGTLAYSIGFYGFKWIDHFTKGSEVPMLQHMTLAALVGLIISLVFAFIQFGVNWKHRYLLTQLENEKFKGEIAQANLSILKNQLDPHFMFNNFNTLYYLIEEDKGLAQKFLKNVSTIYRYILQNNDKTLVPLQEEYQMAIQYLQVIQQRYTGLLTLKDHVIQGDLDGRQVPPLVMQQLIENAIKHNRIDEHSPLQISFKSSDNYLIIENNLNPKRIEHSDQTGLKNLIKRYEYLTDLKVAVQKTDGLFSVSIPLIHTDD